MRLQVTVRHGGVSDAVRGYIERRFAKLDRRLHDGALIEVVLDRERNPKIAADHIVEAEIHVKGPNLVARESASSYEAAVDLLIDRLERQVERQRDKRVLEPRRRAKRSEQGSTIPQEPAA